MRAHCGLLDSSFHFGLLDIAKHHPFVAVSSAPFSPPRHPQLFWSEEMAHMHSSLYRPPAHLNLNQIREILSPFFFFFWTTTGDREVLNMGKEDAASRDWALVHDHTFTASFFYLGWLLRVIRSQGQGSLTSLDGHFFLFILSSFSYTALTTMC